VGDWNPALTKINRTDSAYQKSGFYFCERISDRSGLFAKLVSFDMPLPRLQGRRFLSESVADLDKNMQLWDFLVSELRTDWLACFGRHEGNPFLSFQVEILKLR
jgi:hypothetical protein